MCRRRLAAAAFLALVVASCGTPPVPDAPREAISVTEQKPPVSATSDTGQAAPPDRIASNAPAGASVTASPTQVAVDWLTASRFVAWDQPPTAWIDKVAPFVTGEVNTENQRLRGGSVGAGWGAFVENRCAATVIDAGAVIPPETPVTSQTVRVQVAGTVHTVCETGPAVPDEAATATLTVVRSPVGWKVAGRQQ